MESAATLGVEFLRLWFGESFEGRVVLWWSSRVSEWLSSETLESRVESAIHQSIEAKSDLYFGVCSQSPTGERSGSRGTAANAAEMPGVWCDLDFEKDVSAKKYPPREIAEQCLASLPLAPSVVVETGGGLHIYWLFHDPLSLGDVQRKRATALVKGWQGLIAAKLEASGYDLDRTHDLARVLRVPGSWHSGKGQRVELRTDLGNVSRYEPADLEQYLACGEVDVRDRESNGRGVVVRDVILSDESEISHGRWESLYTNCKEFAASWDHKTKKPSLSEYDSSIARYAVDAGWQDQEVANLIISHRKKWDKSEASMRKVLRPDYISGVIRLVRQSSGEPEAVTRAIDDLDVVLATSDREKIVDQISKILGVQVAGWIKAGEEQPIYSLRLADGREVLIGTADNLIKGGSSSVATRLYETCDIVMSRVKQKQWETVLRGLSSIVERISAADSEPLQRLSEFVEMYAGEGARMYSVESPEQRSVPCLSCAPFVEQGSLHIHAESLLSYLAIRGSRMEKRFLTYQLRMIGFAPTHVAFEKATGVRSSRSYWRRPCVV